MSEPLRPTIGVAVIVKKEDKILIGRDTRKGTTIYGVPGGHWEHGESLRDGAAREVLEESGIVCSVGRLVSVYDFYREDKKRSYLSIGFEADYVSGHLTAHEREGRTEWDWYELEAALALELFAPDRVLLERYRSGVVFA